MALAVLTRQKIYSNLKKDLVVDRDEESTAKVVRTSGQDQCKQSLRF